MGWNMRRTTRPCCVSQKNWEGLAQGKHGTPSCLGTAAYTRPGGSRDCGTNNSYRSKHKQLCMLFDREGEAYWKLVDQSHVGLLVAQKSRETLRPAKGRSSQDAYLVYARGVGSNNGK